MTTLLFNDEDKGFGPDPNFFYLTRTNLDNSIALITKNKKFIFTSKLNENKIKAIKSKFKIFALDFGSTIKILKKYIYKKKVGLDFSAVSVSRFSKLKKIFKIKPFDISKKVQKLRMIKSEKEIKNIQKAVRLTKKVFFELEDKIKPNLTEIDIVKMLKSKAIELNCPIAFEPIVAADNSSINPHHTSTRKKIQNFILIDFGLKYNNYCSDLTRCFFFSNSKTQREYYNLAKTIFFESLKILKKSKTTSEFNKKVFELLAEYKWKDMPHSIGHGIGLEVHELPFFSKKSIHKLKKGMVIALEPSWYGKKFGVRFEEDVLITKNGIKII
ncbi:MAG: M24 family metallopeptidase [Candidatus Anstonellaceae archaeon]